MLDRAAESDAHKQHLSAPAPHPLLYGCLWLLICLLSMRLLQAGVISLRAARATADSGLVPDSTRIFVLEGGIGTWRAAGTRLLCTFHLMLQMQTGPQLGCMSAGTCGLYWHQAQQRCP
jgi:hypothetical protein